MLSFSIFLVVYHFSKNNIKSNKILSIYFRSYGNNAEFCGEIDTNGAMFGKGTYIFPDRTKLTATWINNEPEGDYEYKDPLDNDWLGKKSFYKPVIIFN